MAQNLIEQFAEYLTIDKRRQHSTIATYLDEMKRFDTFCLASNIDSLLLCSRAQIYDYLRHRDMQQNTHSGLSKKTMSKIISCLQSFFIFCMEENLIQSNPLEDIARPKIEQNTPAVLTQEEVASLLENIDVSTPLGIRDRAMLELIYACGLRVSELTGLQCSHILFEEGLIRVLGKGDKERIIPMGAYATYWVEQYMEQVRPLLVQNALHYKQANANALHCKKPDAQHYKQVNANAQHCKQSVFLNYKGMPINRKGVWKNYKRMLGNTALSTKLHTLRHSFATHLLENGMDLRSVQELLGHENLSTTQIYTSIRTATLQRVHSDFHPRNIFTENERIS